MVEGVTKGFIRKDGNMVNNYVIIDNIAMILNRSLLEGWSGPPFETGAIELR